MAVRIELNSSEIAKLLKSDTVKDALWTAADAVARNAGDGYGVNEVTLGRSIAAVYTESEDAAADNLSNNTLLKAAHL